MDQAMNKKLYVGSLPYSVSEEELRDLFSPYGDIESVRIIIDKATGQSKGFAFVEMVNEDDAQRAIEALHGKQLSGRTLIVNNARPETPREQRGGGGGGGRSFSGGRPERRYGDREGGRGNGGGRDRY
jgi:cold-inducible RNA-binding protein